MLKAQVQAISLVLITGIIVSLAGAAYFWGKPLIEKRSTITDVATAESFLIQLDRNIVDVARNRGEKVLNIPSLGGSSLRVVDTHIAEDTIVFQFLTSQPMLTMGEDSLPVPIETIHIEEVGTYGESPRIITLEGRPHESLYMMTLKLAYRELYTNTIPKKGYKIALVSAKNVGSHKVSVSYQRTETEPIPDGGDLLKTIIDVKIS